MSPDADTPSPGGPEKLPGHAGRRRHRLAWLAGALLLLVMVLPLLATVAVRSTWVERAILGAADAALRDSLQMGLDAQRLTIRGFGRSIAIDGLVLGGSADRPLVTVDRVEATLNLRSLLGDEPTIHDLRVEGVRVDLGAERPSASGPDEPAEPSRLRPRLENVSVRGVTVLSGDVDESLDVWLDRWQLSDVAFDGRLDGERFSIDRLTGNARAESHRRTPIEAAFDTAFSGELDGPFTVPTLSLTADGLSVDGKAAGTLAAGVPFDADLTARLDAGVLFPDLTTDGTFDAHVALTHGESSWGGTAEIDARRLPGELLLPLLAKSGLENLALAGSRFEGNGTIDARVTTEAEPARLTHLGGELDLAWHDDTERLLVAHAVADDTDGLRLDVTFDLFPDAPGKRQITGAVTATDWSWPATGARVTARGQLEASDLEDPRWYLGLDRDLAWKPTGDLHAALTLDGPLATPAVDAGLRWAAEGHTLLRADARTVVGNAPFTLQFDAGVLPDEPGVRSIQGVWTDDDVRDVAGAALDDVRVALELPDLRDAAERFTAIVDDAFPGEPSRRWREWRTVAAPALRGALQATATAAGPLDGVQFDAETRWRPGPAETVIVATRGTSSADAPYGLGAIDVAIDVANLALAPFAPDTADRTGDQPEESTLAGTVDAELRLAGPPSALAGSARLTGRDIRIGAAPTLATLQVVARSDGETLELERLSATLVERFAIPGAEGTSAVADTPPTIEARGNVQLARPLTNARFDLTADNIAHGVSSGKARIRLADGILRVESSDVHYAGDRAGFAAEIPLGSLGAWSERLTAASILTATGPFALRFDSLGVAPLLSLFGVASDFDATIDGTLAAASGDLLAAEGELRVSGLRADVGDDRILADGEVRIAVGGGAVTLRPTDLVVRSAKRSTAAPLAAAATLRIAPDWQPGDDPADLVRDVEAQVRGAFEAALLNPFLPGIRATGDIELDLDVHGPLTAPDLAVTLTGPRARFLYPGKYALTLEEPDILFSLRGGRPRLDHARGRLNGGTFTATGEPLESDGILVRAAVEGARMRLDLGVTAQVDADLQLHWPETGMRRLSGRVDVERGILRRDLNLEREALRILFEPSRGANLRELDLIALDLTVDTREGVFIDNNLADLHADWAGLRVTGTMGHPLLNGHIDVAPGGWLNAFGTVYRVDELNLSWADEAPSDVRLVIETTSSIDDPALLQQYRGLAFAGVGRQGPGQGGQLDFRATQSGPQAEGVTAAVVNYYQDKLAGAASGGRTEFSFEPVPLFGETDTQARYTLWQHVSPNTSLIWSVDPRQSEAQTWILDLHGFSFAPRWRMQLFTSDASFGQGEAANNGGATIQQTLEFGGGAPREEPGKKLRKLLVQSDGVSRRRVKAATGYRKGEPFAEGATLDVEVDVIDMLRRRGYPGGEVDVRLTPLDPGRTALEVDVVAGERVDFLFEGERLPRSAQREIRSLYRPFEHDAAAALSAMRFETVRWLRARGFLHPAVRVEVLPAVPASATARRTVRVAMQGGRQVEPGPPVIRGVPDADGRAIAALFRTTLDRVELAAEVADADASLVQSMRAIGFPAARVTGRELSDDGAHLTVDVESGPRQTIVGIGFDGVDDREAAHLERFLLVGEGDPPRFAAISGSYHAMEDDLAARGHVTARVRAAVTASDPARPLDVRVRFEVAPGPVYRIADVRYDGLRGAKSGWVENRAGLEAGALLRREDIATARRRLYQTGVFRRIQVDGDRPEVVVDTPPPVATACGPLCPAATDTPAPPDIRDDARDAEVVFDMEENRRYQVSYGLRWESDTGLGLVVDFVDRNSLGRGHTSGTRAIYGSNLKSLRFYHQIPRIVGLRSSLEFFLEGKDERVDSETSAESIQFWTQFTTPLGARTQTRVYNVFENRKLLSGSREELDSRVVSPRLGWQWVYTTVDRALGRDRKGWFVGLDLSGGHEDLGSDVTTISAFEQLKLFVPFRKKRFNWAQSWRVGVVDSRHEPVALADRLRAGGSYSVRGYPTNSLGPVGPDGEPLGGEVQFMVNQELHGVIAGPVAALVFFDVGNVWESLDAIDSELFKSVGLGARYNSPVGPLRLDIAWPLDRRPDDPTYQIYVGFGQVF